MKKIIKYFFTVAVLGSMVVFQSCKKDKAEAPKPNARFDFKVDADNNLKVAFSNLSLNATSYAWDFGDGETSTEENPTHTYTAAKVYTVRLTASGDGGSHQRDQEVDTRTPLNKLAGDGTAPKVWKMVREGVAINQEWLAEGETEWKFQWNFGDGGVARFDQRTCLLVDEFLFSADGTFEYKTGGSYWSNPVLKTSWGCQDDATPIEGPDGQDYSAWGSGTHKFDYNFDEDKLTLTGMGAHLGFFSIGTDGKVTEPQPGVVYAVDQLDDIEGGVDTLKINSTYTKDDGSKQRFSYVFVSYDNPNDEPSIPGPPPTTDFEFAVNGLEVTFTNKSELADSYLWDFGDGETSTEENPVHTYAGDGAYSVVLTATNVDGSTDKSTNILFGPLNLDFEGTPLSWFAFGGASVVVVPNPASGSINTSANVRRVDQPKGVKTWAGIGFKSSGTFDFSAKSTIKVKVYTEEPVGKIVRIRLEGPDVPKKDLDLPTTKSGQWEQMSFTYDANEDSNKYDKFVLYFDKEGDKSAKTVFFFDDLVQE